jgi:hypothetical protein
MSEGTPAPAPGQIIHFTHYQLPPYSAALLITWSVLTAVVSLAGNSLILLGTIKHNAIRLDKLSLVLIKNLAVSDLSNALFVVIPGIVTLHTGRALLRDNLLICTALSYLQFIVPIFNSLSVCALSLNKLLILLNPLKTLNGGGRAGWCVAVGAWICSLLPWIQYTIIGERTITFDTRICRLLVFIFHCF